MAKGKKQPEENGYQRFKNDLKAGDFPRMYVFYGEETFLIESCRNSLKKKLVAGPAEEFNYHRFNEENFSIDALQEAVEAIPMLSERSLVEVTDINFFAFPEYQREQMAELFSDIPEYCTLLFLYDAEPWKPDKRLKKLYSAMDAVCRQLCMNKQSDSELSDWIRRQLRAAGKTISDDLCRYLIAQTGGSMWTMASELGKLSAYTDQPSICKKDIDDVVIPVLEAQIFDITRDIGSRNFDGALQKMQDLLRQDTEPIAICAVIGKQLREMYAAKVLSEQGKGAYDLAKLYGLWDSAAREVYGQAKGFQKQQLRDAVRLCAQTDYAMKTSGGDQEDLLETMILRIGQLGGK
jgi:DNA polymerase-3 subunit delta